MPTTTATTKTASMARIEDKKKHLWRIGQEAFEKAHSHEEFIQIFGRNFAPELETPPDQEPPGKPPGFTWIQ